MAYPLKMEVFNGGTVRVGTESSRSVRLSVDQPEIGPVAIYLSPSEAESVAEALKKHAQSARQG